MGILFVFTVLCCAGHLLASRWGMPGDSIWFAITGGGFFAVTAAAHQVSGRTAPAEAGPLGEVGSLLVSMAIRLAGTFVILGLLLWLSPLERV